MSNISLADSAEDAPTSGVQATVTNNMIQWCRFTLILPRCQSGVTFEVFARVTIVWIWMPVTAGITFSISLTPVTHKGAVTC